MNIRSIQRLLAVANYYKGRIDGDAGGKTLTAIDKILTANADKMTSQPDSMSAKRRAIAAGQLVLGAMGYEPGVIDGYAGHNTLEAFNAWDFKATNGKPAPEWVRPRTSIIVPKGKLLKIPRQRDVPKVFGRAGNPDCTAGKVELPIRFKIAWNPSQSIGSFSCHKMVAGNLTNIFEQSVAHYGVAKFRRLRLHYFGGCFNNRNKRHGKTKSMHAYGIAVDLDPSRNGLHTRAPAAAFSHSDYDAFFNICEANKFMSGGRMWGRDWMHIQAARM